MKKWTQKNTADLDKELHAPLSLTKYPVTVKYPDEREKRFSPPHRVEVSPNFYRSVKCRMCRRCCFSFSKFWSEREFLVLSELRPELVAKVEWEDVNIELDGRPVRFMMIPETPKTGCPFLDRVKGCLAFDMNPVHCRVALIKLKKSRGVTRITKESFGRSQAMGCSVKFGVLSREEFETENLDVMRRVKELADDLALPTHTSWVIRELKRLFPEVVKHQSILGL